MNQWQREVKSDPDLYWGLQGKNKDHLRGRNESLQNEMKEIGGQTGLSRILGWHSIVLIKDTTKLQENI